MDTGLNIAGGAMAALQNQPVAQPQTANKGTAPNMAAIDKAANEFESVFIAQFLGAMFSGIKADGITGGGEGEMMFRSLMMDKYAEGLQAQGGFGLAAQVKAQMLKMQEV
jgi:Rod binding domain-containing protein